MDNLIEVFIAIVLAILLILLIVVYIADIPAYADSLSPLNFSQLSDKPGSIKTIQYKSFNYITNKESKKQMLIYTPYQYSKRESYNVLILLPGLLNDEQYWLNGAKNYKNTVIDSKNLIDNMIQNKLCDPLIVVCINCWGGMNDFYNGTEQVENELRDIIIPYIKSHYSVKEDPKYWAMYGFSNGAWLTCSAGLPNSDLIGNFGVASGAATANIKGNFEYFYAISGNGDITSFQSVDNFFQKYKLYANDSKFTIANGYAHEWAVAVDGLFEFLQLIYK